MSAAALLLLLVLAFVLILGGALYAVLRWLAKPADVSEVIREGILTTCGYVVIERRRHGVES